MSDIIKPGGYERTLLIKGTGSYLPERIVTNNDFVNLVDTSDEWIKSRTGIKERRFSSGEPTWYMGTLAAKEALEDAEVAPEEIDLIIHSSVSPDYFFPSMSCVIQGKIGAVNAFGIDINCACAGFVYAFDMARNYFLSGLYKNILIIASENLTKFVDFTDRSSCVLFGDGAGAAVLSVSNENKLFASFLASEGMDGAKLYAHSIPAQNIFSPPENAKKYSDFPEGKGHYMYMDGREVYKFTTRVIPLAITKASEKAGIQVSELDYIVPHQANIRIIETFADKLNFPMGKIVVTIDKYSNTSSSSIPIAFNELKKSGKLQRGDRVCFTGFGSGLTYGAAVFEY